MRFLGSHPADSALLSSILFPALVAAVGNIDCNYVVVNGIKFDFKGLEGPHSVMHSINGTEAFFNTTYTLDLCKPLERSKDIQKGKECPAGTRVCAIEHHIIKDSGDDIIEDVIPIAGELGNHGGGSLNAQWTLLSKSPSHHDSEREGLRLEMGGGPKHARADDTNKKQKAIIEFLCDRNRTGLEGEMAQDGYYGKRAEKEDNDEGNDDEKDGEAEEDDGKNGKDEKDTSEVEPSLKFLKYDTSDEEYDVLRLEWTTRYACEKYRDEKSNEEKKESWGFFTWFIIIAFMATAAYLIFGSWLNYNRYGARGWDLLPHGDTIRDVPYLMKDWTRRVVNTVQGGSRGGYSAV